MKHRTTLIVAVLTWLGTFVLLIPYGIRLPDAVSIIGVLCIMYFPIPLSKRPEVSFMFAHSYWIGVMIMLAASGIVILAARRSKRAAYLVTSVDLVVVVVTLLIGILSAAPSLR
jgi:hypothetical protein